MVTPSEAEFAELKDLISRSELIDVEFHQCAARRVQWDDEEAPEPGNVDLALTVQHRAGDDAFGTRVIVGARSEHGRVDVVVAANYELESGTAPGKHLRALFSQEVGIMTLYPYVREAVSTMSAKVFGEALTLPVLPRGGITVDSED